MLRFRRACLSDAPAIAAIQAHYILHSNASFYYTPLEEAAFLQKISTITPVYPFLVCEEEDTLVGFAYASPMHPQDAYAWSAELTIYLHPDRCGRGLGQAMYARLLAVLKALGYVHVYACITADNQASIALHERFGFRQCGFYKAIGYKNGWLDVVWMNRTLCPLPENPTPPARFDSLTDSAIATLCDAADFIPRP